MKKASKLLALLLSVCIALSLAIVFASAADFNQLDASNLAQNAQNVQYLTEGLNNSVSVTGQQFIGSAKPTQGGNTYHRFYKMSTYTSGDRVYDTSNVQDMVALKAIADKNPPIYANVSRGHLFSPQIAAGDYTYTVVTVDFMADVADENGKLLYVDGSWISPFLRNPDKYVNSYLVADENGKWYVSSNSTLSDNDIPISDKVGEWNNFTWVFSGNSCYSFVNGIYLSTTTISSTTYKIDRVAYGLKDSKDIYTKFSVGFDQLSVNVYGSTAEPYTSEDYVGLDDFISGKLYESQSLSTLPDVVFNSNYKFGDYTAASSFSATVNGEPKTYHDFGEALFDIPNFSEGDELIAGYDVLDMISAKTDLDIITGYGDNCYKYSFTKIPGLENELIVDAAVTTPQKIGGSGIVGKDNLTYSVVNGGFRFYGNTPYEGVAGNVNSHSYFSIPGKTNAMTDVNYYPQAASYDFATIDFNLFANAYIYIPDANGDGVIDEADGTVYSLTETLASLSECERATAKLSYGEGYRMDALTGGWVNPLYYVSDSEGNWYLSTAKTYSADGVNAPLANEIGAKNHVTFIYNLQTGKILSYVNGSFVKAFSGTSYIQRFCFIHLMNAEYSPFDIQVSDIEVKYYDKAYESSDKVLGLDDFIAANKYSEYDISFVADIVANATSFYGNTPVKLATSAGDFYYTNVAAALKAANTGDTLFYNGDLYLYDFIKTSIETLYINAKSVTIVEGSDAAYIHTYDAESGAIKRNSVYFVNWMNEDGLLFTDVVDASSLPLVGVVNIETSIKGNYNQPLAWEWANAGSTKYKPFNTLTIPETGSTINLRPRTAAINWYDSTNDENVVSEDWFVGSVASNNFETFEELEVLNNGYYELAYFWTYGEEQENALVSDFTVTEDGGDYYSTIRPVSVFTLSSLKFNYTFGATPTLHFYVPNANDSDISVVGKYVVNLSETNPGYEDGYYEDLSEAAAASSIKTAAVSDFTIGDEPYYKFTASELASYGWYSPYGLEIEFTVNYEDVEYSFTSRVAVVRIGSKDTKLKHASYANAVLKQPCGSKDKVLLLNWMRYMDYTYRAQGSNVALAAVKDYMNHYDCACGVKHLGDAIPTSDPAYTAATGVIATDKGYSASYNLSSSYGLLQITVPKAYADEQGDKLSVYTTMMGMDNETATLHKIRYNLIKIDYAVTIDGVECYYYRIPKSAHLANAHLVQTICIEVDGQVVGSIEYSLAKYLYNANQTVGLYTYDEAQGKYVRNDDVKTSDAYNYETGLALYYFSEAAYNYKLLD